MTGDISDYSFDFAKEAQDLIHDLGWRGKNILFAEADIDWQREEPVTILHSIGDMQFAQEAHADIKQRYKENPLKSSFRGALTGDGAYGNVISIRKNEKGSEIFGAESNALLRLFILYHETAHALIDGPRIDNGHPYREAAADAYAAIRFLQRFGQGAVPLLSMISWSRAYHSIDTLNTSHLSTTVLDKIIADSATVDFSKLTSAQTIRRAENYARKWTPDPGMLAALRNTAADALGKSSLLLKSILSSPDDFSFYIGAKFFQPLLQPEGIVLNGEAMQYPEASRQKRAVALAERAAGTSLSSIFNKRTPKTEPPLAQLLKVSRPKNQKAFVANL